MLIFKSSQVIKYYVMFAFLFVQTVLDFAENLYLSVGYIELIFRKFVNFANWGALLQPLIKHTDYA